MNILIIGNGGREHALAWKCAQSEQVDQIYVAPGNAGTACEAKCSNIAIAATDIPTLLQFAQTHHTLTIVGPEAPLVLGIVDQFEAAGLAIYGPKQFAAQLEGSKSYAKDFLKKYHIPTAHYQVFDQLDAAQDYLRTAAVPIVIKADGLAAGKGVVVAFTLEQALDAVHDMLAGNRFGDAGARVVIEEFLVGEEASFIVMCDGHTALPMASSQDHKRVGNGETGANTGGMGAYSPAPVVTPAVHQRVMQDIIEPTLRGMAAEGCAYTGFLYAGLMIDKQGNPKVIEFNCRFGDPETQPILLRLQSDLVTLIQQALAHRLAQTSVMWDQRVAVGVVMAAENYPETPRLGDTITGLTQASAHSGKVFHAGTQLNNEHIQTCGGRVLCATALGENIVSAQKQAYQLLSHIHFAGGFYRTDIGWQAIDREK